MGEKQNDNPLIGHFDDCKTKSDGMKKFFDYANMIRAYELEYDEWVRINDEYGQFVKEMVRKDIKKSGDTYG